MIKILKLQKAVVAFILGVLALIGYKIMSMKEIESSDYLLSLAGILFIGGALMAIFPIIFAKKTKDGVVELDPEKQQELIVEEEKKMKADNPTV